MDNALYDYSPLPSRPKQQWPGGARVAFYVGLNIEHFEVDKSSTSLINSTAHLKPDALNHGWRDYGARVGFWRLLEALDKHGVRASALLNSDCCERYPQIIEAGRERHWAWLAHGQTNSSFHADLAKAEERELLIEITQTIAAATGTSVKGWMGPGLTETFETPRILRELGYTYVLDWCADDQPFPLRIPGMISVPYSVELNDYTLFLVKNGSGEDFYRVVVDQFDRLYEESAQTGRVMALALHPLLIGHPFRFKYLDRALEHIVGHDGVWLTTSDEIAEHYLKSAAPGGS
jgi:allantoinase